MGVELMHKIARIMDVSCVRTDVTKDEIDSMIAAAKKYRFICAFAMPCFTEYLKEQLRNEMDIKVGGVVGFPSGAETTRMKVNQVKELLEIGCNELDMVISVSSLKSKIDNTVFDDIKAVVETAGNTPVKTIIEAAYLTEAEIVKACEIAASAGVSYVKTGTGWANKPTDLNTIKLIKSVVGNRCGIKAAGGVRNLKSVLQMCDAGCSRFGVSLNSAVNIMEEARDYQNDVRIFSNLSE